MKTLNIIGIIFKWILVLMILLFALAIFMGKNYEQSIILFIVAMALVYWPKSIPERWGRRNSLISRIIFIVVLSGLAMTVFKSGPQKSIYTDVRAKQELMGIYDKKVKHWPEGSMDQFIETGYGRVHVLVCGDENNPPLLMLHAASMAAHSWYENLAPLVEHYRIFAIDNIGEGNKSELNDPWIFPRTGQEIADLYSSLMDSLHIERAPVFGASNGGYIAQCLAFYHPEKVQSLLLFGPMGLTELTSGSIFMLAVSTMYPFQFTRNAVARWALGEDLYCREKYGDWFNCIMKSTIPSVARPVPMTTDQKRSMALPVLLFLGTNDRIIGDADVAQLTAHDYPNIQIELLESGHLIAVEKRNQVNKKISEFLVIKD